MNVQFSSKFEKSGKIWQFMKGLLPLQITKLGKDSKWDLQFGQRVKLQRNAVCNDFELVIWWQNARVSTISQSNWKLKLKKSQLFHFVFSSSSSFSATVTLCWLKVRQRLSPKNALNAKMSPEWRKPASFSLMIKKFRTSVSTVEAEKSCTPMTRFLN